MSDLAFEVTGARAVRHAAVPTLAFPLRISETTGQRIHTIVLNCQLRIEPEQRRYDEHEEARLLEIFGDPARWGDTLKPFLWTDRTVSVPGFVDTTEIDLRVTCPYDLEVTAGKYFEGLAGGEVPLLLLFSGTVFVRTDDGGVAVDPIPWDREARFRLPVATWRELLDAYWPGSGWLRLRRDTIARLQAFKSAEAIPTWDDAIARLLETVQRQEIDA